MRRTLSLSAAGLAGAASLALAAPAEAAPVQAAAPASAQAADGWSKWKTGKIKKPIKGVAVSWKYHTRWEMGVKELQIQFHLTDTASDKRHPRMYMEYTSWSGVKKTIDFKGPHKKHTYRWWNGSPRSIKVRECVAGHPFQRMKCNKTWTKVYNYK
ncbi:hypothetical protein [Actinomadura rudentiformis]|uniref:Uncharacterized protein n=1 Tax=Actinomadura rudentiformis TaxID=359158 RepID=A0A6H9YE29_9ACTN|nr:hypothetical protein [Actinomadura rudentiformis]KAB2343631.1 hypothetical protein F8566_33375 [Actinomadura rudentiformis]